MWTWQVIISYNLTMYWVRKILHSIRHSWRMIFRLTKPFIFILRVNTLDIINSSLRFLRRMRLYFIHRFFLHNWRFFILSFFFYVSSRNWNYSAKRNLLHNNKHKTPRQSKKKCFNILLRFLDIQTLFLAF